MASFLPRRRYVEPHQAIQLPVHSAPPPPKASFLSISPTFILLLFITIWCTSLLLSSSFHICVSSHKLDHYCISGRVNRHEATSIRTATNTINAKDTIVMPIDDEEARAATNTINPNDSIVMPIDDEKARAATNTINANDTIVMPIDDEKARAATNTINANDTINVMPIDDEKARAATNTINANDTIVMPIDDEKAMAATNTINANDTIVMPIDDEKAWAATNTINANDTIVMPNDEKARAIKVVQEQVHVIRSWASRSNNISEPKSCDGRGIFVYDLPPKFNRELLSYCKDFLRTDLCHYFENEGMGQPIPQLGKGWYRTHQYSLELIFHSRILNHPCRVWKPSDAKLFYVPFYGGLDILRWHLKNVSMDVKDALASELVRWLEAQPAWQRNAGKDHMFVLGKISWDFRRRGDGSTWGNNFLSLDQMQAPYKFMIERQPWKINDIGIPHPTHFHPHTDDDIMEWQARISSAERKSLVSFAGAARPGSTDSIRSTLIKNCVANGETCRFLDCASGRCASPEEVITEFMTAEFCLQPPGDSPTRKSVFDSLVAGCIPVLFDPFTAYYQYAWHLPEDHRKYSVFIAQEDVREGRVDVVDRLKSVTMEERKEMRRYIIYELMPSLVYGESRSKFFRFRDAFGVVMDNVVDLVTKSSQ